jgi:hypothetical protein
MFFGIGVQCTHTCSLLSSNGSFLFLVQKTNVPRLAFEFKR